MKLMFTRILTDVERKHAIKYIRQDGKKEIAVRKVVYGARRHLTKIKMDVELLEELLASYGSKTRSQG